MNNVLLNISNNQMIIISLIVILLYFLTYKFVNRIKIILTINSILSFILSSIFNLIINRNINEIMSTFLKLNDNFFTQNNITFILKFIFILLICLINYILIKIKKYNKDLRINSFDFSLNILSCLIVLSTKGNIFFLIVYLLTLLFYWSIKFSYNRNRTYDQEFDFHIHTSNSDGEYSTHDLVQLLKRENFKYFSITDHDSIKSMDDIKNEKLDGMKYISGVEISTILDNKYKMHILGYNFTKDTIKIKKINEKVRLARIDRIYEMAEELKKKHNIEITKKEIDDMLKTQFNTIGKPHLASLIVKKGYASSIENAIVKYLEDLEIKTQYRIDFKEVVDAIHSAGGKVLWAHPKKVENKYNIEFTEILDRMIELGLDGIEVYNSIHTKKDSKRYLKICNKKNLLISGGSDYHGPNVKRKVKLGVILKDMPNKIIDINTITLVNKIKEVEK